MSVPIATSPGRSGIGPQLSLSYDSGAANGVFGFGWSLSAPSVTRKTDKGLPRYQDPEESDVFLLSGAEDLVPVLDANLRVVADTTSVPGYTIHRYRPRIEGLFTRIERWTDAEGSTHWRSISKDNILTLYGADAGARIADPDDARRVFSWLVSGTRDDKGNGVLYDYVRENGDDAVLARAHQSNRGSADNPRRGANRYLKRIRYGNRASLLDGGRRPHFLTPDRRDAAGWMFEVVFDYDEDHVVERSTDAEGRRFVRATVDPARRWTHRADAFSTYRAGFEVRTARLCHRVLVFHHFAAEPAVGLGCLVRSTDFSYEQEPDPTGAPSPSYTFLRAVTASGHVRSGDRFLQRSLPAPEFGYTAPTLRAEVEDVATDEAENLPPGTQWVDLHGEGLAGVLTEQPDAWYYRRNLSPLADRATLAPRVLVLSRPNLGPGEAQFMDLAGDGRPDLVTLDGLTPGLYEHDLAEGWGPFQPFDRRLNRSFGDPDVRLVDLDGDGRADVLVTEDEAFVWHSSLGEAGFGPAERVAHSLDEERGPRLTFSDGTDTIFLADLSGDGLTDLVRVRNGEVCYWPNLSHGRFGAKISMDAAPLFDHPDLFEPRRLRLADVDGTGTADLLYLHRDGVRLYFNESGNAWSGARSLPVFPCVDDLSAVTVTDLLGDGTACLVWASALPGDAQRPLRYVRLMAEKPHLLTSITNGLGADTRMRYAPSTRFFLADRRDGRPWMGPGCPSRCRSWSGSRPAPTRDAVTDPHRCTRWSLTSPATGSPSR